MLLSPIPDYLDAIVDRSGHVVSGERADYIPEPASDDPDRVSVTAWP
ncbi:hypothetical protein ABZ635_15155 [Nocardiopsis sp. NPDC007018]